MTQGDDFRGLPAYHSYLPWLTFKYFPHVVGFSVTPTDLAVTFKAGTGNFSAYRFLYTCIQILTPNSEVKLLNFVARTNNNSNSAASQCPVAWLHPQ